MWSHSCSTLFKNQQSITISVFEDFYPVFSPLDSMLILQQTDVGTNMVPPTHPKLMLRCNYVITTGMTWPWNVIRQLINKPGPKKLIGLPQRSCGLWPQGNEQLWWVSRHERNVKVPLSVSLWIGAPVCVPSVSCRFIYQATVPSPLRSSYN